MLNIIAQSGQAYVLTIGAFTFPSAGTGPSEVNTTSYIIPASSAYSYTGSGGLGFYELR
jgi:hypothetical protein